MIFSRDFQPRTIPLISSLKPSTKRGVYVIYHHVSVKHLQITKNDNYLQDKGDWIALGESTKSIMRKEAMAAILTIVDLEPMIEENDGDILTLRLQSDREGVVGDVRDILIIRQDTDWIIGISVKHNHFAVKHSRLYSGLDFGKSWLDIPCSETYRKTSTVLGLQPNVYDITSINK